MNYFQKYLVEEFAEDNQKGHMTSRQALKLIASVTGSLAMASSILAARFQPLETAAVSSPAATAQLASTLEPTRLPTATLTTAKLISRDGDRTCQHCHRFTCCRTGYG
jgi:hypothetical protein